MQFIPNFSSLASRYDGFLLDLWGVVHDGTQIYPGAKDCLEQLHVLGKKVVFLSNAPRRAHKVASVLAGYGVKPEWYTAIVSSGEAGFLALQRGELAYGPRYYYIGPARDADMMDGLHYTSATLEEADFVLNLGFGSEGQATGEFGPVLARAAARDLPMLCLNPDLEVVKISGERYPCAGAIAAEYEKLGGSVRYFGKPYAQVYDLAMHCLGDVADVLAVGDSLHHDIAGARAVRLDSALVTGGLLRDAFPNFSGTPEQMQSLAEHCGREGTAPDHVLPRWSW